MFMVFQSLCYLCVDVFVCFQIVHFIVGIAATCEFALFTVASSSVQFAPVSFHLKGSTTTKMINFHCFKLSGRRRINRFC